MKWLMVDTIKKLPPLLWNTKVSQGYALTSEQFLAALEVSCSAQQFLYFVAYKNEQIVACSLLNISRIDLSHELPQKLSPGIGFFRKFWPNFLTLKVAMTASPETFGSHFWYDESALDLKTFIEEFYKELANHRLDYSALIMRDHISGLNPKIDCETVYTAYKKASFIPLDFLPVTEVDISPCSCPNDYLSLMKSRDRYNLKKEVAKSKTLGVVFEFVDNYEAFIDECYPLYLAVNQSAKELRSEPLPKRFFTDIKQEFGDKAYMLLVKNKSNKLIAFALITDTQISMNIYVVGMDYSSLKKDFSMYNMLWECMSKAITDKRKKVELGLTNYFLKERLGARIMPMTMFVRAENSIVRQTLKRLIKNNAKDRL